LIVISIYLVEGIKMLDLTQQIIDYESGDLSTEKTIELFSILIKNGMAWSLQGCYGRTARHLIDIGILNEAGEIDYEQLAEAI